MKLTKEITAEEVNEFILTKFLHQREEQEGFTFLTRTNDKVGSRRLANGWWFHGNHNYVFASLFKLSGHNHMSRSIGFVVGDIDLQIREPKAELLVVWPGEPDEAKIQCYKRIVSEIEGFEEHQPDRFSKRYDPAWTLERALDHFLSKEHPRIKAILSDEGFAQEAFVTETEMEQYLSGVAQFREDEVFSKTNHHQNLRKLIRTMEDEASVNAFFDSGAALLNQLDLEFNSPKLYAAIRGGKERMHITVGGRYILMLEKKGDKLMFGFHVANRLPELEKKYGKKLVLDKGKHAVWYKGQASTLDPVDFEQGMMQLAKQESKATASQYRTIYGHLHNQWIIDACTNPEIRAEFVEKKSPKTPRIWRIAAGANQQFWPMWSSEEMVGIGWDVGDLSDCRSKELIGSKLKERYGYDSEPTNSRLAMYQFAHEMKKGDWVVAKDGTSTYIGIGRVTSEYQYRPDHQMMNSRQVDWLSADVHDNSKKSFSRKTLTEITSDIEELSMLESLYGVRFRGEMASDQSSAAYGKTEILDEVFLEERVLDGIMRGLAVKKNVILQGPPGTGKTFIAKRLAYLKMGNKDASRVETVQFHQSYSYEDFIQGYRPHEERGFARKDGVFLRFCERAKHDLENDYFFIIDEINRGNLSKIFGELMMLIEADKRGTEHQVQLTYSEDGEHFYIPENVHIIGTMNTADRSLAMVDYALRRRFAFYNLPPQFNEKFDAFLEANGLSTEMVKRIATKMLALNQAICEDKNLGTGFEIGHSYFCSGIEPDMEAETEDAWFQHIMNQEIGPQLFEYWFDDPAKATEHLELLKAH